MHAGDDGGVSDDGGVNDAENLAFHLLWDGETELPINGAPLMLY